MSSSKIFFLLFISCNVLYQSEAARVPPTNTTGSQDKGGISPGTIAAIVVPISVVALILLVGIFSFIKRIRKKYDSATDGKSATDIVNLNSLKYEFRTIEAATNKFSEENKLGRGRFGVVYKGMLSNGKYIAVKRLSRYSERSGEQFKNEVEVLAKLQHKNLVRLLGFCVQREEKILVYEYMPSRSIDYILFEIISGIRHYSVCQITNDDGDMLLSRAWKLWKDGKALELLDPTIRESCNPNEVMRCIHIGMLCVQRDQADRPSMSSILLMLQCYPMTLPTPSSVAYLVQGSEEEDKLFKC